MSTKLHNRREGDRSEYFAQVLLSGLGLSTPVPRQEDIGVDFVCSLADKAGGVVTFGHPYLVSVKSIGEPNIELTPTDAAIKANSQRHLEWLFRQELPLFLCVVDKDKFQMAFFSLIPLWFLFYNGGPQCGSLIIKPRVDSSNRSDVGEPKKVNEIAGWPGMFHYEVDVGHPIAVVNLDTLKDPTETDRVRSNIRRAAAHGRKTQAHRQLGVPYFQWIARTQPDGKSFWPGFAQYPMPDDPVARVRVMMEVCPALIAFALYFKKKGDLASLKAIRVLLKDLPLESFEAPVRSALPELFDAEAS